MITKLSQTRATWSRMAKTVVFAFTALATASTFAGTPVVAVFSKTMNGYTRPNRAETFVFADGGRLPGAFDDDSIDKLNFSQVAGVIAASLQRQNYVQTFDAKTADLLIFVSFGTTTGVDEPGYQNSMTDLATGMRMMNNAPQNLGTSSGGMVNTQAISDGLSGFWGIDGVLDQIALSNEARYQVNRFNAEILGYDKAWHETNVMRPYLSTARDILSEIEESRYFVVLKAYDFQELRQHKQKKLLWLTRYNIRQAGNRFDDQLVDMTRYASQFFGQNVDRLLRRHLPEGHVEVGTPVVVPTSNK